MIKSINLHLTMPSINFVISISTHFYLQRSQICAFPHINDNTRPKLNFIESGTALTQHMCKIGNINSNSNVIDFGCGIGGPAFDISQSMNCRVKFFNIHIFCIFYYLFFFVYFNK